MTTDLDTLPGQKKFVGSGRAKFLLVVCCLLLGVVQVSQARTFVVKNVYDGDTVRLEDGRVLRLYGLDTPEMGTKGRKQQYFASAAKKKLSDLVLNQQVEVLKAGDGRDRFGRVLAILVLPDQRVVNELLLRGGFAFYFPHPGKKKRFVNHKQFLLAQRQAMEEYQGFWPEIFSLSAGLVYGNRRSRRFHLPSCHYTQSISGKNRQIFSSLQDAFYAGFAPCRSCSPWPLEKKADWRD